MQQQDWHDVLGSLAEKLAPASEDISEESAQTAQQTGGSPSGMQALHIVVERKGRAGKTATIICGFTCDDSELCRIASELKRAIACGGSARGGEILLQGDRAQAARRILTKMKYKVKG